MKGAPSAKVPEVLAHMVKGTERVETGIEVGMLLGISEELEG